MKKNKIPKPPNSPLVYIPPGARINSGNFADEVPFTEYDKRRVTFDLKKVKKVTRGRYGKNED